MEEGKIRASYIGECELGILFLLLVLKYLEDTHIRLFPVSRLSVEKDGRVCTRWVWR